MAYLRENPGIALSAAADHDGTAAGLFHQGCRRRAVDDVAVADDRDGYGIDDGFDFLPVRLAAIELFPRPSVDGDGSGTSRFSPFGQFRRRKRGVIPAGAHLDRDRDGHGADDGTDDFLCQGQVLHQGRAVAVLDDFLDGTAHIDIDDIGTVFFDDGRCLGHDVRVRAENLHGQGVFPVFDVQQFFCMLVAVADTLGTDHFRADQGRPIAVGDDPVRRITDAGHRGQDDRGIELDLADGKGLNGCGHK